MSSSDGRMLRYGAAGAFVLLWTTVSAWIIGGVGERHRKNLREGLASTARPLAPAAHPGPPETSEARVPAPIAPAPPADPTPAPPPEPRQASPVVADRGPTPMPMPAGPAAAVARAPTPGPVPASTPASSPPVDPFWEEPDQKKAWDLDHLTVEDERQLGQSLNRMIRKFHPPLKVGPLPRRLQDATEPYRSLVARKDVSYTPAVLDCESPNAFSLPGGYIYICRGLFDWISEDEDYALEFLIAHEMAHVDLAHAIQCLRDPAAGKLQLGTVPMFYFVVIPWGYKPEQEFEADRWAYERMMRLGRSRYEALAFLRKLEDYSKSHGFENEPMKPMEEPRVPWLDNHIRTHPIPRDRLKRLKSPAGAPAGARP